MSCPADVQGLLSHSAVGSKGQEHLSTLMTLVPALQLATDVKRSGAEDIYFSPRYHTAVKWQSQLFPRSWLTHNSHSQGQCYCDPG